LTPWIAKGFRQSRCDYSFHCIITELADAQLEEMTALVREGVTSFKLFMAIRVFSSTMPAS